MHFRDRTDAAQRLAKKLEHIPKDSIILAIPRGGVVIGDVVAKTLEISLDVIVSRKIGSPHNPELAIGAVAHDGSYFPNPDLMNTLGITQNYLDECIAEQMHEIERRLMKFRGRTDYYLKDKTVVIVDDGIATGATMFVALKWIEKQQPKKIIIAIPVGPKDTIDRLRMVSEIIVLHEPVMFGAVGEFYDSFEQVEDEQVIKIMQSYGFTSKK
jgi:predicted phosphoribosyltransferase